MNIDSNGHQKNVLKQQQKQCKRRFFKHLHWMSDIAVSSWRQMWQSAPYKHVLS